MSRAVCELCFHHCAPEEGQAGFCRARGNRDGRIVALNYGRLTALALDPIEKKPLRRFRPGSRVLSVGSFGCNLRCPFCQNHEISMAGAEIPTQLCGPEALAAQAEALRAAGNIGLAYTYNEPLVGYEFVRDCARRIRERGMVNVLVSNGTIEAEPWEAILPLIDAANIDLKCFTEAGYRTLGGDLETVKRSIAMAAARCHVEITCLVVPGFNDSEAEIAALCDWIAALGRDIPLHLNRYFPRFRAKTPPTDVENLLRLAETARKRLGFVYVGNC